MEFAGAKVFAFAIGIKMAAICRRALPDLRLRGAVRQQCKRKRNQEQGRKA